MDNRWSCPEFNGFNPLKTRTSMLCLLLLVFFHQNLFLPCSSLNSEGLALLKFRERVVRDPFNSLSSWRVKDGVFDHCSWFGVHCSDGKVVILNLKDLCLGGTIAPELGNLAFIKSIILRNNAFSGIIPSEIGDLKELEVLDLGYNDFIGPVPNLENNFSLSILLLDNNEFLGSLSPELDQLQTVSEHQVDESQLSVASTEAICSSRSSSWYISQPEGLIGRSLLQVGSMGKRNRKGNIRRADASSGTPSIALSPSLPPSGSPSPSPSPSPSHSRFHVSTSLSPSPSPSLAFAPSPSPSPLSEAPSPTPAPLVVSDPTSPSPSNPSVVSLSPASAARVPISSSASNQNPRHKSPRAKHHKVVIWGSIAGASAFLIILALAVIICRTSKVVTVKPWATGLSGQLQKAFVSGVPKLKRSELELACEDFSNIIGSLNDGTVYKGTLSSGVEIAVVSSTVKSREHWSRNLEAQFRKKIETLSKVNHKNFVNLIGYCEEEKPFTRMMVFEYAPNGTLFEHLHIKEAERLDWGMRLRIIMGMAYCLDHMHQLNPPISHRDLKSCSIYLAEDYATKISDFSFWNELTGAKMRSPSLQLLEASLTDIESNVFNFGVVLFEIITGKIPFLEDNSSLADWVLDYLERDHIPRELVDPTLSSYQEEEVQKLFYVIRDCMHHNPRERPKMKEIVARLREITRMGPDGAIPKLSPLWWAELEVLSMEAN